MQQETRQWRSLALLSVLFLGVLIWSAVNPKDYFTWILEVSPGVGGFIVLGFTYRRFRFTNFLYVLMLIQCVILFVGGHYTYAEVPLFDWIRELVGGTRNNYDKVGHFAQGFVPAMIARELILRLKVTRSRAWTNYFAVSSALMISALYELIEWWTALLTGESAEAFLGTQGYVWDTQSDMLLALIGSVAAVALFSRYHDAKMKEIGGSINISLEKHG
jgi:putative membrane protein